MNKVRGRIWNMKLIGAIFFAFVLLLIVASVMIYRCKSGIISYFDGRDNISIYPPSHGFGYAIFIQKGELTTEDIKNIRLLSRLPFCSIQFLSFADVKISSEAVFPGISSLKILEISNVTYDAKTLPSFMKSLNHLLASPNLGILKIKNTLIPHEFWSQGKTIQVGSLHLEGIALSEDDFLSRFNLENASAIHLEQLPFTNKTLEKMKVNTSDLEFLQLSHMPIHGEGLRWIPTSIQSLELSHTQVSDDDLQYFSDRVRTLDLSATKITNQGLKSLPTFVRILNLSGTSITNVKNLQPYAHLKEIYLNDLCLENDALATLPQSLERLHLDNTTITDEGLEQILNCKFENQITIIGDLPNSPDTIKKLRDRGIHFSVI